MCATARHGKGVSPVGLDQYLYAKQYVSGYSFQNEDDKKAYRIIIDASGLGDVACQDSPSATVSVTVAYWRKANAIHHWFVTQCQNGRDECQEAPVSREQIEALIAASKEALAAYEAGEKHKAGELLTPTSGFFFGSTEVDDYYASDLKITIAQLEPLLKLEGVDFSYQASW